MKEKLSLKIKRLIGWVKIDWFLRGVGIGLFLLLSLGLVYAKENDNFKKLKNQKLNQPDQKTSSLAEVSPSEKNLIPNTDLEQKNQHLSNQTNQSQTNSSFTSSPDTENTDNNSANTNSDSSSINSQNNPQDQNNTETNNFNNTTEANDNFSPSPTPTPTISLSATPTQTPTKTPFSEPTPTPIPTSTPTPPFSTPTPTSVPSETKEVVLLSASPAVPNADGQLTITALKHDHGYWDFVVSGSFRFLQPQSLYQLWFCNINCSSHDDAKFMTDDSGSASLSEVVINHPQVNDPVSSIRVWELPPAGEIIEDSNTCYGSSNNSSPCLNGSISF